MNFLLHILGLPQRTPLTLRPSAQHQLRAEAANALAKANLPAALAALKDLTTESHGNVGDTLARAHLHLALNEYPDAETFFALAIERIGGNSDVPSFLDHLIESGENSLRQSLFVRATQSFQKARAAIDTLLAAQSGLIVAQARQTPSPYPAIAASTLLPLARLGDLLLRMLARTHLAGSLANCLRERSLRDDLASWATSTASVDNLLNAEFQQFTKQIRKAPSHAELHFRLGLVSRTLGHHESAAHAFTRVLNLHPHHLPVAARLAATHHDLGNHAAILPTLAIAFSMPPNVLEQYAALATAAQSPATFDQTAESLAATLPPSSRNTAKPNLAFALSQLGLLDNTRAQWREPALT